MVERIRFAPSEIRALSSYSVVEGNRFVDRKSVYVMGSTIVAHPDVIDSLRGYGRLRRLVRRTWRALCWRLVGRPRFRRSLRRPLSPNTDRSERG